MKRNTIFMILLALMFSLGAAPESYAQIGRLKGKIKKEARKTNKQKEEPKTTEAEKQQPQKEEAEEPAAKPASKTWYVAKTGSNRNPGTKNEPLKNLDKAIKNAGEHDKIYVAEGVFTGTFDVGYFLIDKPLELYGSYNTDFTKRDPVNTPTVVQTIADKAASGKQSIFLIKETHGVVIDGFTIDMGRQNNYDKKAPEGVETGYLTLTNTGGTPKRAAIKIIGNDIKIQNNTFSNIS